MPDTTHERTARFWKRPLPDHFLPMAIPRHLRSVTPEDIPALSELFFSAFFGTIDHGGQTEAQYASKAKAILGGRYGEWIPEASWTIEQSVHFGQYDSFATTNPTVAQLSLIATAPSFKRMGGGGALLEAALVSLQRLGYMACCAMITAGNAPSELLFASQGFAP